MPFLRWDGHPAHVMRLVTKLYKNLEFFDCTLDTNGGLVHGHTTILVACSPYLKKLIMDHRGMEIIPCKEVKYNDMKLILNFVYFGEVDVSLTDVPSLMKAAQLLQITSLSSYSQKFLKKSSADGTCDRGMDISGMCGMNLTKYDDSDLSVPDKQGIGTQDLRDKVGVGLTANCENIDLQSICGNNTNPKNVLKELSQKPKLSVRNSSETKMDMMSEREENFKDDCNPIAFVAVSPFSIKREHIDDEQSASCIKNPLEKDPLNCDMNEISVKMESEYQPESEVKREIKEENDIQELDIEATTNASVIKALEMNCMGHDMVTATVGDNMLMTTENICGQESMQNATLLATRNCDSSKGCFAEGMQGLVIEFESICDTSKCDLKDLKPSDTGRGIETIDDNNDCLILKEASKTFNCGAETMSLINFEQDVSQELDVPNTEIIKIEETADVLERTSTHIKTKMGNSQSGFTELGRTLKTRMTPSENESEKFFQGDLHCSQPVLVNSGKMQDVHATSAASYNDLVTQNTEDSSCARKNKRKQHVRSHNSGLKSFSSNISEQSFNRINVLKRYVLIHTDRKQLICNICKSSFSEKGNLKRHMRIHTNVQSFKCGNCDASFSRTGILRKHMRIHASEKSFECGTCKTSFSHLGNLNKHLRIHTGEKPFKCGFCESAFSQRGTLKQHIRTHTCEKPFKCDFCESSFSQTGTLKKHIRIHTGEKPFKCDVCDASFSVTFSLKKHMQIHTSEKPYKCDICVASFARPGWLKKHMRIHTSQKPSKSFM